jgi:elongation factor Ts
MDPNTGAIRAMASNPGFDPAILAGPQGQKYWNELAADAKNSPLLNRALNGLYPAGSTFKPVTAFAAGASGLVGMYRHHNGKLATIVQITASSPEVANHEATKELVKYIAEHVAAAAPIAVDRAGVSPEKLEAEKRVAEGQARETGKPEAMIEKIATGKVEAFLKDVTLMPQAWVRDASLTIAQLVADHAKKAGGEITVDRFARLQLGAE